jgi:hypothetical protein
MRDTRASVLEDHPARRARTFTAAQVNLVVAERLVRAQTVTAAIDHVADRLRHRLTWLHRHLIAEEAGRVALIPEE